MKKYLILLALIILNTPLFALDAGITFAAFKGGKVNYIESHIFVNGRSVAQRQIDSIHSIAEVEVELNFFQNKKRLKSEKFKIISLPSLDPIDFRDVRRFNLPDGFYDVEILLTDTNKKENVLNFKTTVQSDFSEKLVRQSDILLLSKCELAFDENSLYPHYGYTLDVLPFQLYDNNFNELQFYTELYNLDKASDDAVLFSYTISAIDSVNGVNFIAEQLRQKAIALAPQLIKVDIHKMRSGTYKLTTKLISTGGSLLNEREVFFQRFNPNLDFDTVNSNVSENALVENDFTADMNIESVDFNLKAIAMNINATEIIRFRETLTGTDATAKKKYLLMYWSQKNAKFPDQAFEEYMFNARSADKNFASGTQYGFETDRGRTFMKYGRPSSIISVDNEENTPPYEIWEFDKMLSAQGKKVKFIFYNTDKVDGNFRLLQSNCINETNNPTWLKKLYKNVSPEKLKTKDHPAEALFNNN